MKILLKGYYGFGNFGDDLLMLVFFRILCQYFPKSEIYIFSNASVNNPDFKLDDNYNKYIKTVINRDDIHIIDWMHKGHFDFIFDGGGGVYFDYCQAKTMEKLSNRLISLLPPLKAFSFEKLVRSIIKKSSNISFDKRYSIGTNIGPFSTNSKNFISIYTLIGSVDGFLVRDMESFEYLHRVGYKGSVDVIPDIVFSSTYLPEINQSNIKKELKNIGIIIMNWKDKGKEYLDKFEVFAKQVEANGYKCHFFSCSELDDKFLEKGFAYPIIYWKPNKMSVAEYLSEISTVDMIISMRFHGMVIATSMGIPSVGVGINTKIIDFTQQASTCSKLLKSNFSLVELKEAVEMISLNYDEMVNSAMVLRQEFGECEIKIQEFMKNIVKKDNHEI